MVVYSQVTVTMDDADTQVLYVIRDAQGNLLPELASAQTMNWKNMWINRYFYPTVPNVPAEAGSYTVEIYFDGELAISKRITIE